MLIRHYWRRSPRGKYERCRHCGLRRRYTGRHMQYNQKGSARWFTASAPPRCQPPHTPVVLKEIGSITPFENSGVLTGVAPLDPNEPVITKSGMDRASYHPRWFMEQAARVADFHMEDALQRMVAASKRGHLETSMMCHGEGEAAREIAKKIRELSKKLLPE